MKKPQLEEQMDILWEKVSKYLPKKYQDFIKKYLFTAQEFHNAIKALEEPANDILKARALISEELWSFYQMQNMHGLPEQKIYEKAVTSFTRILKEKYYAKKEPQEKAQRGKLAKGKQNIRVPKGQTDGLPNRSS